MRPRWCASEQWSLQWNDGSPPPSPAFCLLGTCPPSRLGAMACSLIFISFLVALGIRSTTPLVRLRKHTCRLPRLCHERTHGGVPFHASRAFAVRDSSAQSWTSVRMAPKRNQLRIILASAGPGSFSLLPEHVHPRQSGMRFAIRFRFGTYCHVPMIHRARP